MEAKNHSIHPRYFLLASTDSIDDLSKDKLFDMRRVEDVLADFTRHWKNLLERSKLQCMSQLTYWYSLFPLHAVIPYFRKIIEGTPDLCLHLGISLKPLS